MCVYQYECMLCICMYQRRPGEDVGSSGARIIGNWEPPGVATKN